MRTVNHKEFLITKYILLLKKHGIQPFWASLILGASFNVPAIIFAFYQKIPLSFGYFSCLSWLFFGPFLIYEVGKMVDELWPKLRAILSEEDIKKLQVYEKRFHGRGYLIIGIPDTVIVSFLVFITVGLPSSPFAAFYLISWVVLALLGAIGIWGTFVLISMIWKLRKQDFTLNPYNPDGFGGMGLLADFAVKATVMYSTGALMIPMAYDVATRNDLLNQTFSVAFLGSTLFSLTVLLSFIVQVVALNRAAVMGRNKLLVEKGKQCIDCTKDFQAKPDIAVGIQMLVSQNYYEQIRQMRVYPFDLGIVLKLAGSIALPIVLGTIRIWLPWLPIYQ